MTALFDLFVTVRSPIGTFTGTLQAPNLLASQVKYRDDLAADFKAPGGFADLELLEGPDFDTGVLHVIPGAVLKDSVLSFQIKPVVAEFLPSVVAA